MAGHPDFLCIGAHKAATSWLYVILRSIDGVFLPAIKETNYFVECGLAKNKNWVLAHRRSQIIEVSQDAAYAQRHAKQLHHLGEIQTNDGWYKKIFQFANAEDICGEISPSYLSMPTNRIRHALCVNPHMRALVLVRDPVDRAWSHMRMAKKLNYDTIDFESVHTQPSKLLTYLEYSDYATSLNRWKDLLGEDRLKTIVFERIRQDPASVIAEVLSFIGVPHPADVTGIDRPVFAGDPIDLPTKLRAKLFAELQPQYEFLHPMFPDQVEQWTARHLEGIARQA